MNGVTAAQETSAIGRYSLLRRLGSGRRSEIYLAASPDDGREVVLRFPHDREAATMRARYRREAEIAGQIPHPGVLRVLEVGDDPLAGPFLVTEWVDGINLGEALRLGELDVDERFRILLEVLLVLEAAHARGIVHEGLRPERVLLGSDGTVRVDGFGRGAPDPAEDDAWAAVPPERVQGVATSPETDAWAFAVLAFELLTEDLPYGRYDFHDPDGRAPELRSGAGSLSREIQATFARALARDPALRFRSPRAFLRALVHSGFLDETVRAGLLAELDRTPLRTFTRRFGPSLALSLMGAVAVGTMAILGELVYPPTTPLEASRLIEISSVPAGATVLVDGAAIGTTPRRAHVAADARRIRVEKVGYKSADLVLPPEAGKIGVELEPWPVAQPSRPRAAVPDVAATEAVLPAPEPPFETVPRPPRARGLIPWILDLFGKRG